MNVCIIVHNDGEYRQMLKYATCMLLPLYRCLVKTFFFPQCVVFFVLIHAELDNKNVNKCLILSIINTCYLISIKFYITIIFALFSIVKRYAVRNVK